MMLIGICLFGFIFLASVIGLISLSRIDLYQATNKAFKNLSRKVNAEVSFEAVKIRLFPLPCLELGRVNFNISDQGHIRIDRLSVYPKIGPLFRGDIKPFRIKLENPSSTVLMDRIPFPEKRPTLSLLKTYLDQGIKALEKILPGLTMEIVNGKIDLFDGEEQTRYFTGIYARLKLPPRKSRFEFRCRSGLWQELRLKGWFDSKTFTSDGRVSVQGLHVEDFPRGYMPFSSFGVSHVEGDFDLTYSIRGPEEFMGKFQGILSDCLLHKEKSAPVPFTCENFKGSFQFARSHAEVAFDRLVLPFADVSGRYYLNRKTPSVSLEIEGNVSNVAKAREAALVVAGRFITTQKICDIIRDGEIPRFSFLDRADSHQGLKKVKNILIQGKMVRGNILTPKSDLDLTEVFGDVTLSKGVLDGKNLKARFGGSSGTEGTFAIGMTKDPDSPFYLETLVDADLSQLPPVLKKLIKNENINQELDLVKNVRGKGKGTLVLERHKGAIRPRVKADAFSLSGDYERVPWAIQLDGAEFSYVDSRMEIKGVNGAVGKTTIEGVTAQLDWQKAPWLICKGEKIRIFSDEIHPWIMTFKSIDPKAQAMEKIQGFFDLADFEIKGPLLKPGQWEFDTSLEAEKLVLTGMNVYRSSLAKNTALSIGNGEVHWSPENGLSFLGVMALRNGPKITIEFRHHPEGFNINSLHIKDDISDAVLAVSRKGLIMDVSFQGKLSRMTLDKVVSESPFPMGSLEGSFHAVFNPDRLEDALLEGWAKIGDVPLSQELHLPIRVESAEVKWGKDLHIISGVVALNNNDAFTVNGSFSLKNPNAAFDLELDSSSFDLTGFLDQIKKIRDQGAAKPKKRFWESDVKGKLGVNVHELRFGGQTWSPVSADLSLSPEKIDISVREAKLCGFDVPGTLAVTPGDLAMDFQPEGKKQSLEAAFACFGGKQRLIEGSLNIDANIRGNGPYEDFSNSVSGDLTLLAEEGRIFRFGLLSKIFSILNITEIFRGTLPDLVQEGFKYTTMDIKADIAGDKIVISKGYIDGDAMDLFFQGEIHRPQKKLDIILLVAPLKTVDFIIKKIPVLKHILKGGLVSIAFRISGDFSNPDVIPLPPSAVGGGILGMVKNTLKLPVTLIQPLLDKEKEN